jgi:hypothetical protein
VAPHENKCRTENRLGYRIFEQFLNKLEKSGFFATNCGFFVFSTQVVVENMSRSGNSKGAGWRRFNAENAILAIRKVLRAPAPQRALEKKCS